MHVVIQQLYKIQNSLVEISCADLKAVNQYSQAIHIVEPTFPCPAQETTESSFYPRTVVDWNALQEPIALS